MHLQDRLTFETSKGTIVVRTRPDLAPAHVERIRRLAAEGFYDGRAFFRVIPNFMAQAGCPDDRGLGGSDYEDLPLEVSGEPHVRGACSMARADHDDSANSQFFICTGNSRFLDKQFTVWGNVVEGMEVVDALEKGERVERPDRIVTVRFD